MVRAELSRKDVCDEKSIRAAQRRAESAASSWAEVHQMSGEAPMSKGPAGDPLGKTTERDQKGPCALPMDEGACLQYVVVWYFHPETDSCRPFIYGGCGGNGNRFPSKQECERRCKGGKGR
ncbi:kunitz-type serine protease inhibitor 4-like [Crotalus tigris]|uniref:kunitz-type serine protease inhibitor 4-like n=1 Tax=Crotalus tigris TaxID=88082 RepID=UPI00192F334A|nr:kunitz-type serine protease inhibitor 4-like [Crotalus tigris]